MAQPEKREFGQCFLINLTALDLTVKVWKTNVRAMKSSRTTCALSSAIRDS